MNLVYLLRRCCFSLLALVLLTLGLAQGAGTALAGYIYCSGDPILTLSDGTSVSVNVEIETAPTQVQAVVIYVHVGRGVELTGVDYGNGPLKGKETVLLYNDGPAAKLTTETIVKTKTDGVPVTATTTLSNGSSVTVEGFSPELLEATVNMEKPNRDRR